VLIAMIVRYERAFHPEMPSPAFRWSEMGAAAKGCKDAGYLA